MIRGIPDIWCRGNENIIHDINCTSYILNQSNGDLNKTKKKKWSANHWEVVNISEHVNVAVRVKRVRALHAAKGRQKSIPPARHSTRTRLPLAHADASEKSSNNKKRCVMKDAGSLGYMRRCDYCFYNPDKAAMPEVCCEPHYRSVPKTTMAAQAIGFGMSLRLQAPCDSPQVPDGETGYLPINKAGVRSNPRVSGACH